MKQRIYSYCLWILSLAIGVSSCVQGTNRLTVSGCVTDATMNAITLVTPIGDTLNISKLGSDPLKIPEVLINDSVKLTYIIEKVGGKEVLKAGKLTIMKHSPYFFIHGTWVEPNPINPSEEQGVTLKEDGTANSVGMATLAFEQWEFDGDKLLLTSKSIGSGQTHEGIDTLQIVKLNADSLVLSDSGNIIWQFGRKL